MMAPWVSASEVLSFYSLLQKKDNTLQDRQADQYPGCSTLCNLLSGRLRHGEV